MMKRRLSLVIAILSLLLLCGRLAMHGLFNMDALHRLLLDYPYSRDLSAELPTFSYCGAESGSGKSQYMDGVPMEEMDFLALDYLQHYLPTGYPRGERRLPCKITYYRQQNGRMIPAFTVKKGTMVELGDPYMGYGYATYPTYQKGWRYAIPFSTDFDPYTGNSAYYLPQENFDYYYVRQADIEKLLRRWMWESYISGEIEWSLLCYRLNWPYMVGIFASLRTDAMLFEEGIYESPDLSIPIWYPMDTVLILFAAAGIGYSIFVARKKKGKS